MKNSWKDIVSIVLAIIGMVVIFAKLESYSWWLIGSWKGGLAVLGVIGLGMLLTNIMEFIRLDTIASIGELVFWLAAATVVITSLLSATSRPEFVVSAVLIGIAWASQLWEHLWEIPHHKSTHLHAV